MLEAQEGIKELSQEHEESVAGADDSRVMGVNAIDEFTGLRKPIRTLREYN